MIEHPILTRFDDLDAALGNSADVSPTTAKKAREIIAGARKFVAKSITAPQPGSTTVDAGATITHRPDLVYDERARQAAIQGDADRGGYLPAQRALASVSAGVPGPVTTIQPAAPEHPAEVAKTGVVTR